MSAPGDQDINASAIHEVKDSNGSRVRVIAGNYNGTEGAVRPRPIEPVLLDLQLPAGTVFDYLVGPAKFIRRTMEQPPIAAMATGQAATIFCTKLRFGRHSAGAAAITASSTRFAGVKGTGHGSNLSVMMWQRKTPTSPPDFISSSKFRVSDRVIQLRNNHIVAKEIQ